jgi:hypothetical protein
MNEQLQPFKGAVESKIMTLRNQYVILDSDVAELYEVETRDINKAVKNNPEKFPEGYIFELQSVEKQEAVENFHRFENLKHSTVTPKAFTEKGLYMLATILKSRKSKVKSRVTQEKKKITALLQEAQDLLDNNKITAQEYETLKANILAKP